MNRLKHILFPCLLPVLFFSQSIVSVGGGRTMESNDYRHVFNIDVNYLLSVSKLFALKAGTELEPGTAYALKYNYFLTFGVTSDLDKTFSAHLFVGFADNSSTNGKGNFLHINDQTSPMLNAGGFMRLGKCKNFMLGLEVYMWQQSLDYHKESFTDNALSVNITAAYRLNFPKKKSNLSIKEKPVWNTNLRPYNYTAP